MSNLVFNIAKGRVAELVNRVDQNDPTGSSADSALIPLTLHDFAVTPDGNDIVAQINAAGFYRAS